MKKLFLFLCLVFFVFSMVSTAGAELITRTVSATLTNIDGSNLTDLSVNTQYDIFTVTYDDEGTAMHQYWDDGQARNTWDLSYYPSYDFFSDAEYSFSSDITAALEEYTEYDRINYYMDRFYSDSGNTTYFDSNHDSYRFWGTYNHITMDFNSMNFYIYGTEGNVLLSFGDPSSVSGPLDPVPEPATMLLLGSGLVGLAGFRRKFKKA